MCTRAHRIATASSRLSGTHVNLSNALNACFARPSDATIAQERCAIQPQRRGVVPSPGRLTRLREALGASIFGFQDKNPGACTIECPRIQWKREYRMYYGNTASFHRTAHTDHSYWLLMRAAHAKFGWERLASFPSFADFTAPYGYCFQKHKDAMRDRPIVSYSVHPLRRILNMAARGFLFIFKNSGLESFTLHTVQDMLPTFTTWMDATGNMFGRFTRWLRYMGDIKEMFTRLPHDRIKPAVDFILDLCASTRRGRARVVCVEKRARGAVRFGRCNPDLLPQFANLTFSQIREIIMADIALCLFKSLGVWLQQYVGIPMGSPLSPVLAICTCAYAEHQFHASIRDSALFTEHRRYFFMRYVDDLFGVVAYDSRSRASLALARETLHRLVHDAYDPNLILKAEPVDGWFPLLSSLVHFPASGPVAVRFHNKNWSALTQDGGGAIKFLKIQHRSSFMSAQDARARILGALHRLHVSVSSEALRLASVLEMFCEFRAQGYSAYTFCQALRAIAERKETPVYGHMCPLIMHLR